MKRKYLSRRALKRFARSAGASAWLPPRRPLFDGVGDHVRRLHGHEDAGGEKSDRESPRHPPNGAAKFLPVLLVIMNEKVAANVDSATRASAFCIRSAR